MIWYFFILGIVSINLKNAIPSLLFLGIAFLVKYEAVSFYNTSAKSILSITVSTQKKAAYFFAFSSSSSKYLSKSDIKSLS